MIRAQVSFDEHEYALAKREAKALGISVAEFLRRAVRMVAFFRDCALDAACGND
jgi:hypothetical protein